MRRVPNSRPRALLVKRLSEDRQIVSVRITGRSGFPVPDIRRDVLLWRSLKFHKILDQLKSVFLAFLWMELGCKNIVSLDCGANVPAVVHF